MKLSRREIREKALQTLFQLQANPEMPAETAMKNALNSEVEDAEETEEATQVPEYLEKLVLGVMNHQDEVDQMITEHLRNWSIKRLARTDLLLLRIAVYELMYEKDISPNIAINEAIELTKMYSDEKSRKFVNGVLSNVNRTLNESNN